jgi:hypothetical protein
MEKTIIPAVMVVSRGLFESGCFSNVIVGREAKVAIWLVGL